MGFTRRQMKPKARILLAVGNLCIFTSLSLTLFARNLVTSHSGRFDFVRGLLLGVAIVFNFSAVRMGRCGPSQPAKP